MKGLALIAVLVAACSASPAAPTLPVITAAPAPTVSVTDPIAGRTGKIAFGNNYDHDTLAVTGPTSIFKTSAKRIAWSASLWDSVNATSVTWILATQSKTGVETVLFKEEHDISNPDSDTLANAIDLGLLVGRKPGTYVMRYLRGKDVLAEGTFTLVK